MPKTNEPFPNGNLDPGQEQYCKIVIPGDLRLFSFSGFVLTVVLYILTEANIIKDNINIQISLKLEYLVRPTVNNIIKESMTRID